MFNGLYLFVPVSTSYCILAQVPFGARCTFEEDGMCGWVSDSEPFIWMRVNVTHGKYLSDPYGKTSDAYVYDHTFRNLTGMHLLFS